MSDSEEPKIIVDEDWKSQVEKEKEQLRKEEESKPDAAGDQDIPEASFQVLLATLGTQAMAMMGLLATGEGAPSVNLPMARHVIDMIGVLEEKTKGNLTDEEAKSISENLHQLRMVFVQVSQNPPSTGSQEDVAGKESQSSTIELP